MTAVIPPIVEEKRSTTPEPYSGVEKRADWHTPADCFKLVGVQQRLDDGSGRMKRIEDSIKEVQEAQAKMVDTHSRFEQKLDANSKATTDSATATAEILEIISTAKGFFKGASVIGAVIKWGLGIATAVLAFVVAIKSGGK